MENNLFGPLETMNTKSNQNIRKINRENKEAAKENKSEDKRQLEYGCSIGDMLKAKGQKL